MDGVELLPVEIAEALERGAIVVTGNQRAARALRRGWDQRNRERGLASWTPAAMMAWDAWMATLWRSLVIEGYAAQLLLNRTQEHAVWRSILESDATLASLQTVDSLAQMAADAWRLISNYQGERRLRGSAGNSDTRAFQRWAIEFERTCRVQGLLASSQLEDMLGEAVKDGQIRLPASGVALLGFDAMTPAQKNLLAAMRSAGMAVEELQPAVGIVRRMLVNAADEQTELGTAARWILKFLEEKPAAKVAVIVPNLETRRSEIDRVFREVLAPELEDIRAGNNIGPYEFSLGVALAETPMIAAALDLLRWSSGPLSLERVSGLLLSPYFAMKRDERGARAEFDAFELRKARMLRPEISLDGLIAAIERSKRRSKLSRLLGALRTTHTIANRLQGLDARTYAEWTERMRELLTAAVWGSGVNESSVEFQIRHKWESALDELATLDFDGVRVEFEHAQEALERIARQTTFAPESRDAPVQIMGPLEAAGGTFDAVWFLRCGELSWPIEAASSSLLPWPLQHELKMPGTDVARDSEYASRMTERIANSAATSIFSYAKETAEGKQRPSPVLAGLRLEEIAAGELVRAAAERAVVALEEVEDVEHVHPLPDRVIRGGARVLELQAACAFRAFAELRLWSTELESIAPGMNARESGTVVHDALKRFWDEVRTLDALRTMTLEERDEALNWCITEALKRTEETTATTWDAVYMEVQRERLHKLLSGWLELEMERPLPFEVKLSEKEFTDVRVGPLRLNVRMDRVDIVEDGEVLIDYKTGAASPNDWLTERPDAPQLPLYAILSEAERLRGVAFGLVRAGEGRELKGYTAREGVLPGRLTKLKEAATFETQVERWRQVLVALAVEFAAGDARVQPKSYPKTCEHCGQRLLCRLDVSLLEADEQDDTDAVEEVNRG
jgi:ATP-dependent helicase/nuclease subunit B